MTLLKKGPGGGGSCLHCLCDRHCLSLPRSSWVTLDAGPTPLHFSKAWRQFFSRHCWVGLHKAYTRCLCFCGRMSFTWAFPGGSEVGDLPAVQETPVRSLGWEDPLEEEAATRSSVLAWEIPRTEEPGKPQSMGSKELDLTEQLNNSSNLLLECSLSFHFKYGIFNICKLWI